MMSQEDEIRVAMGLCTSLATKWNGEVCRTSKTKYATRAELLTGKGSQSSGGRWNRGDIPWSGSIDPQYHYESFPTVYTSLDYQISVSEMLAFINYYNIPQSTAFPSTTVFVRVELFGVLDLARDDRALKILGVTRDLIRKVDWRKIQDVHGEAITQRIGYEARNQGFEGLLVPSAAKEDGMNLVLFPDNRRPESTWEILDPGNQLPS